MWLRAFPKDFPRWPGEAPEHVHGTVDHQEDDIHQEEVAVDEAGVVGFAECPEYGAEGGKVSDQGRERDDSDDTDVDQVGELSLLLAIFLWCLNEKSHLFHTFDPMGKSQKTGLTCTTFRAAERFWQLSSLNFPSLDIFTLQSKLRGTKTFCCFWWWRHSDTLETM